MKRSIASLCIAATWLPGCYLVHERDAPDAATVEAGCFETHHHVPPSDPATPPAADAVAFVVVDQVPFAPSEIPFFADDTGTVVSMGSIDSPVTLGDGRVAEVGSDIELFDLHGLAIGTFRPPMWASSRSVAWHAASREWIVAGARQPRPPGVGAPIDVDVFDEDGALRASTALAAEDAVDVVPSVAATDRDVMLIIKNPRRTLEAAFLTLDPLAVRTPPFVLLVDDGLGNAVPRVHAYGDRFLVTGYDGHEVRVSFVDPGDCATAVQPVVVAPTGIRDVPAAVAAVPERGFFVVCYADGPGPHAGELGDGTPTIPAQALDGISIQAMGDDGTRWGQPFHVATDLLTAGPVDCAWNGREVVVGWRDAPFHGTGRGAFVTRLRPTFVDP